MGRKDNLHEQTVNTALAFIDDNIQIQQQKEDLKKQAVRFVQEVQKRAVDKKLFISLAGINARLIFKPEGMVSFYHDETENKRHVIATNPRSNHSLSNQIAECILNDILPLGEDTVRMSHTEDGISVSK